MNRIGPRMKDLLHIILFRFDGKAPSKASAYMCLNYHGGSSNQYGSRVMKRLVHHGLVRPLPDEGKGNKIPVEITDKGRECLTR